MTTENKTLTSLNENFPILNILPNKITRTKEKTKNPISNKTTPRYKLLPTNCKWNNIWPTARNFHPYTVPLPIHMSYVKDNELKPPIGKFNNPELLKIPNFLHLTPLIVEKHCEVLKPFCTKWPSALKTDDDCDKHFPLNIITKDFVFSGPSIRWPNSRIVELRLNFKDLKLDEHAQDKMKRLLCKRYNAETGLITIRTDSCPLRKQNYDYAQYLLTALYFESWKTEPWELEKEYSDWERYFWDKSKSRSSLMAYFQKLDINDEETILKNENTQNYADAVTKLYDEKESTETLERYKKSVLKILF